ncbi:unnamed protein product [Ambrosiozyma monospora]|uniref:Unnamed protein product n=1 Tax=Ambrosiozyma monospora TaxID=43982 RepID=A0ACB5T2K3_AMBMO|nr:unnamed protein product [Ambrosiozyma monospora]
MANSAAGLHSEVSSSRDIQLTDQRVLPGVSVSNSYLPNVSKLSMSQKRHPKLQGRNEEKDWTTREVDLYYNAYRSILEPDPEVKQLWEERGKKLDQANLIELQQQNSEKNSNLSQSQSQNQAGNSALSNINTNSGSLHNNNAASNSSQHSNGSKNGTVLNKVNYSAIKIAKLLGLKIQPSTIPEEDPLEPKGFEVMRPRKLVVKTNIGLPGGAGVVSPLRPQFSVPRGLNDVSASASPAAAVGAGLGVATPITMGSSSQSQMQTPLTLDTSTTTLSKTATGVNVNSIGLNSNRSSAHTTDLLMSSETGTAGATAGYASSLQFSPIEPPSVAYFTRHSTHGSSGSSSPLVGSSGSGSGFASGSGSGSGFVPGSGTPSIVLSPFDDRNVDSDVIRKQQQRQSWISTSGVGQTKRATVISTEDDDIFADSHVPFDFESSTNANPTQSNRPLSSSSIQIPQPRPQSSQTQLQFSKQQHSRQTSHVSTGSMSMDPDWSLISESPYDDAYDSNDGYVFGDGDVYGYDDDAEFRFRKSGELRVVNDNDDGSSGTDGSSSKFG